MTIDKTIAAMLLAPFIGLCAPAALLFWKMPAAGVTAAEKELINFSAQPVAVSEPGSQPVYAGLECPVRPPAAKKAQGTANGGTGFPPGPIPSPKAAALPKERNASAGQLPTVSMIYSDSHARMAIIDGHVLREGASLGAVRIVKIEKARVLVRTDGRDIWLNID
ncbi:MAG: general secretion pathway protein GspB [Deltaproteobacteria bacterium]|nr:general secretion pathway protein GspB [Deltaproteobacteria bacterium]